MLDEGGFSRANGEELFQVAGDDGMPGGMMACLGTSMPTPKTRCTAVADRFALKRRCGTNIRTLMPSA